MVDGGPWSFDSHPLIFHRLLPSEAPANISLNFVDFWVQIYNLPIDFMSETVGKMLGNFIGKFVEDDTSNNSTFWRNYMRIRVSLDVQQPLKRFKKVKKQGGEWVVVQFKYERLGSFCFICGILGHSDRECSL